MNNDLKEVEDLSCRALAVKPLEPYYLVRLGFLLQMREEESREAEALYRRALTVDPGCRGALCFLAILVRTQDAEEANGFHRQLLECDLRGADEVMGFLGFFRSLAAQDEEAAVLFNQALKEIRSKSARV